MKAMGIPTSNLNFPFYLPFKSYGEKGEIVEKMIPLDCVNINGK
jgi:hypothetical protein